MSSQERPRDSGNFLPNSNKSRSASPHPYPQFPDPTSNIPLDPSIAAASFSTTSYAIPNSTSTSSEPYGYNATYLSTAPGSQGLAPAEQNINTGLPLAPPFGSGFSNPVEQPSTLPLQQENYSNLLNTNQSDFDFSLYQNPSPTSNAAPEYDSSLLLDPQVQRQQGVNPADLVSQVSPPHISTSPQLPPQDQSLHQHSTPSPISPPSSSGPFYTPQHSRNTSLDPATAAYLSGHSHPDWQAMMNNASFQGHRRAPSEVSEVSSAAHSPYMSQHESSFDAVENNPSPLLAPQNDPSLYDNALGIESFTLTEQQQQHQHQQPGFSPGHSPYISPQLMPQQGSDLVPNGPYISAPLAPTMSSQYPTPPTDLYATDAEGMMAMAQGNAAPGDLGQASHMAPPSINVEFAPPAKDSTFRPSKAPTDLDSLSPPTLRSRMRSKSDPYTHPRSRSPASTTSLEPQAPSSPRSLSPFDSVGRQPHSNPSSRDPSPSRSGRRLSTSSIDSRNYILDLADPQRPGAAPSDSKRVQKHPATFQCHLCPKRFTRAYNLRSHLRTHTDERPFVCTVCGKAFARQHDRKRHEGLHSGEKKFVCRGDLSRGGQWGCGRRFARADALGRHFRSEAGRICIKPLLDEESHDRERAQSGQQQQQSGHLQPIPPPLMVPNMDGPHTGSFVLPAALIAQYPALQTLQWDQIPATTDDLSDVGGRSSFDASSGGEFGFEDDESGMSSVSGMSGGYGGGQGNDIYGVNQSQMLGVTSTDTSYPNQAWRG